MSETYTDDLLENYDNLRADRDWSHAVMAEEIERRDASLAAQYREKFVKAEEAPKGRRAASKSQA